MAIKIEGIITGSHAEIAKALSEETGIKMFPGDEHLLKNPNILGVKAGTHKIIPGRTMEGRRHPMVVPKNRGVASEPFI